MPVANSLAVCSPDVAALWDDVRNGDLTPEMVFPHSHKKVWWVCGEEGHRWEATIGSLVGGSGCPYCASGAHNANDTAPPVPPSRRPPPKLAPRFTSVRMPRALTVNSRYHLLRMTALDTMVALSVLVAHAERSNGTDEMANDAARKPFVLETSVHEIEAIIKRARRTGAITAELDSLACFHDPRGRPLLSWQGSGEAVTATISAWWNAALHGEGDEEGTDLALEAYASLQTTTARRAYVWLAGWAGIDGGNHCPQIDLDLLITHIYAYPVASNAGHGERRAHARSALAALASLPGHAWHLSDIVGPPSREGQRNTGRDDTDSSSRSDLTIPDVQARDRTKTKRSKQLDLVINYPERTISVGGQSLDLTHQQFALLAYFSTFTDQVLPYQDLLAHGWRENATGKQRTPSTLREHVFHLRRKLEVYYHLPRWIFTARGVGYWYAGPRVAPEEEVQT